MSDETTASEMSVDELKRLVRHMEIELECFRVFHADSIAELMMEIGFLKEAAEHKTSNS